ncbi:unnamed protein product [Closterium sp. NIES-65]|nr:unnamed protein product [Closterium sp. NIES-65]
MATHSVLTFDAKGRAVDFDVGVDDLELFLQCDKKDSLSLFDLTSGASPALTADADSTVRSQWATRDAAARLAVRSHLPSTEHTHFSQYKSAKTLGAPPPHFCPLLPPLLPSTSLAPSRTALRLPLAGDPAPARARGARALEGLAGAVEVAVEAAKGVGVAVGVMAGVEALVAAVEAEAAAVVAVGAEEEAVAAVAEVAAAKVELLEVALRSEAASVVVSPAVAAKIPRWGELFRLGVAIFDLDYDAILAAMYVVSTSDEGDCYLCVPPDPGNEAAALDAGEAAALGASASAAPGAGLYLPSFSTNLHRCLGHPSLPRLRGMASFYLVCGLPRSLPPLPPGPARTYVPCVEGRQRAAPHSSEFPPTKAPLQTLHMDVWGPARVRGLGQERYFLLVVDDYSHYTSAFPLRSKGDVTEVLIDWICAARLQLRESFGSDFPVLRLHSDRGRRVFPLPSGSLLSCTGQSPDVHASGLSTAKWDC